MKSRMIRGKEYTPTNETLKKFFLNTVPNQLKARVDKAIELALMDLGNRVLALAKERAPMDTGALRASGRIVTEKGRDKWIMKVVFGGQSVEVGYAFYVEYNMPDPPAVKNYTTQGTGPLYLTSSGDEIITRENINKALRDAFKRV